VEIGKARVTTSGLDKSMTLEEEEGCKGKVFIVTQ
jgi:hypothetical protein